jgi:hypothetical protein
MLQQRTNIVSDSFPKAIIVVLPARCHRLIQGPGENLSLPAPAEQHESTSRPLSIVTSSACRFGFDYTQA